MTLTLILVAVIIVVLIIASVRGGAKVDESTRRQLLLDEARRTYPNLKLVQAVDCLYVERIRRAKAAARSGKSFDEIVEIEEDIVLLTNERSLLLQKEIDEGSEFDVEPFKKRYFTDHITRTSEVQHARGQRHN